MIGRSKVQSPTWVKFFFLVEINIGLFKSKWTFKLICNLIDLVKPEFEWYLTCYKIFFLQNFIFFKNKTMLFLR